METKAEKECNKIIEIPTIQIFPPYQSEFYFGQAMRVIVRLTLLEETAVRQLCIKMFGEKLYLFEERSDKSSGK